MSELRWILLGAGVALILALWWWETRKAKAKDGVEIEQPAEPLEADDPPPTYTPTIDRLRVPRRPPLVEIPEDLEVDISDFVGIERRHAAVPEPESEIAEQDVASEPAPPYSEELTDDHHRAPWIRTQPLERDEVAPRMEEEPPEPPPADAMERRTAEASKQRIVALRLVAPGAHWSGADLRRALEAEGLNFGPYSIFHREREDGKTLLYVASMMEPGSFDLDKMDRQDFPGISIFGIVPGPLDAPSTFDLVLTVGRGLADRMKGQLQDEQGSTLTSQRILNLREELVHFEHRNRRLRRS